MAGIFLTEGLGSARFTEEESVSFFMERERLDVEFRRPPPAVEVSAPGHEVPVNWAPVTGATTAEVETASATLAPAIVELTEMLSVIVRGQAREITIPKGKRLLSLTLEGLKGSHEVTDADGKKKSEDVAVRDAGEFRLVVSGVVAGKTTPLFAIPPVDLSGMRPAMFDGATFSNGVLTLPPFDAAKIHLALTLKRGDDPKDWTLTAMQLASQIPARVALPSTDLELRGADNALLWQMPGAWDTHAAPVDVDLKAPLQAALKKALSEKRPIDLSLRLVGAAKCRAGFQFSGVAGSLVRKFDGVTSVELKGDPSPLPLPLGDLLLAEEAPSVAAGDLLVRYEGLRLLETVSDPVPDSSAVTGVIVTAEPVVRVLPPDALTGLPLARIGLIGRAPEECELAVQLNVCEAGLAREPLLPAIVLKLPASTNIATQWAELPDDSAFAGPMCITVHCTRGRFFWVAGDAPRVRLAVRDPNPGGRALRLGGTELRIDSEKTEHKQFAFTAAAFRAAPPVVRSDLFLTVEVADLELKYRR